MIFIYEITIGEIITAVILAVTAFIVLLYTRAAQKSNEIQERPILNLYLRESQVGSNIQRVLRLRNVGNGPAYNIKFFGIEANGYMYYPYFNEPNPILENGGDEKPVNLWVSTPDGGVEVYDNVSGFELFLSRLFNTGVKRNNYDEIARSVAVFLITYEGINDRKYYSIFRLYSKIVPLLPVYDLVVEFINNGQETFDMASAKCLCRTRPIMKKNEQ